MASEKVIVLVSDRGDSKHGEISVLDDPSKAERLVETLLEAGFEEERIRVFTGTPSEFQISHRPIVALVAEGREGEAPAAVTDERPERRAEEPAAEAEAPESAPEAEAAPQRNEDGEEVAAGARMAAPVRFSSLFRSA